MSILVSEGGMICIDLSLDRSIYNQTSIGGELIQINSNSLISEECVICLTDLSSQLIGVLVKSQDVSVLMNSDIIGSPVGGEGGEVTYNIPEYIIGIKGVCTVKMIGSIKKGDNIVSAGYYGCARQARSSYEEKYSIGLSLETSSINDNVIKFVKCYIK